jgi:hypothetical protein
VKRPAAKHRTPARPRRTLPAEGEDRGQIVDAARELALHRETSPELTGGDVDADWRSAASTGEEAVGGSVATPDQDVVDEIGRALGVEQPSDRQVRTSEEILRHRDRRRWRQEP